MHDAVPPSDESCIPIASLNPPATPSPSTFIKAIVALVFPYSSATKTAAFLIAEPDFRLRRSRGQVRILLQDQAAKAVATSGVGIGDTVLLKLEGAKWAKDVPAIGTPGRSVDGELVFAHRLQLEIERNNEHFATINVDEPEPPASPTPNTQIPQRDSYATPIQKIRAEALKSELTWKSPVFLLRSSKDTEVGSYDTYELDDGGSPGKGRKRTRFSGGWTYTRASSEENIVGAESRRGSGGDNVEDADVVLGEPTGDPTAIHAEKSAQGQEVEQPASQPDLAVDTEMFEVGPVAVQGAIPIEDIVTDPEQPIEVVDLDSSPRTPLVREDRPAGGVPGATTEEKNGEISDPSQAVISENDVIWLSSPAVAPKRNEEISTMISTGNDLRSDSVPATPPLSARYEGATQDEQPLLENLFRFQDVIDPRALTDSARDTTDIPYSENLAEVYKRGDLETIEELVSTPAISNETYTASQDNPQSQTGPGEGPRLESNADVERAPVVVDLISPTQEMPPSPPPSQPVSQIQNLLPLPNILTPETTGHRLSDMVSSATQPPSSTKDLWETIAEAGTNLPSQVRDDWEDSTGRDTESSSQMQIQHPEIEDPGSRGHHTTPTGAHKQQTISSTAEELLPSKGVQEAPKSPPEMRPPPLSPISAQELNRQLRQSMAGFRTKLSYYTPLSLIRSHLNPPSHGPNTIDVLGIATSPTSTPIRAQKGPKDFNVVLHVADFSCHPETIQVQVLRPYKLSLPVADIGDVVLLRNFVVKSRKRNCFLLSAEASAWVVWRQTKAQGNGVNGNSVNAAWTKSQSQVEFMRDECNGPPVELGNEEHEHALALRRWWEHVDDGSFPAPGSEST